MPQRLRAVGRSLLHQRLDAGGHLRPARGLRARGRLTTRSLSHRRAPRAGPGEVGAAGCTLTHSRILMKPSGSLSGLRLIWKADIL